MCYRVTFVDYTAGLLGTIASLMAYANQPEAGGGATLSTNLLSSGVFLLSELIQRPSGEFAGVPQLDAAQTGFHPAERFYKTADGWVAISACTESMAFALAEALDLGAKLLKPRVSWSEAEAAVLQTAIARLQTDELVARLETRGVWVEKCPSDAGISTLGNPAMQRAGIAIRGQHPVYGEFLQLGALVGLSRSRLQPQSLAPQLGEHTRGILAELGYPDGEVEDYYRRRIVV